MLEAINGGVAIQTPVIKSDDSIAPDKVARIADQKVQPDQEIIHDWGIKENGKIKEEKNVEDGQKEEKEVQVSQDLLDDLEANINTIHNVGLEFSIHEELGRRMIKVVEKDTGNLIRQIPPEEILDLAVRMNEVLGIIFDERV